MCTFDSGSVPCSPTDLSPSGDGSMTPTRINLKSTENMNVRPRPHFTTESILSQGAPFELVNNQTILGLGRVNFKSSEFQLKSESFLDENLEDECSATDIPPHAQDTIIANVSKRPVCKNMNIAVFYSLDSLVATGAFGEIYQSTEIATGVRFAVKKINKAIVSTAGLDWMNEFRIAEQMNHTHIVRVHQVFDDVAHLYIVMELLSGEDLFQFLSRVGSLPANERIIDERYIAHLMRQMLSSLEHCHSRGVVHRDVKPENFIFTEGNDSAPVLKLIDFGLAASEYRCKNHKENQPRMRTKWIRPNNGLFSGSPHYVAPEVVQYAGSPYNELCDLWSVGIVMFFLFVGDTPTNLLAGNDGGTKYEVIKSVQSFLYEVFDVMDSTASEGCYYHSIHKRRRKTTDSTRFNRPPVKISSKAFCLLDRLLEPNPALRITSKEAVLHSWLVEKNPTAVECCDSLFVQQLGSAAKNSLPSMQLNSSRINLLRDLTPRAPTKKFHKVPVFSSTASGAPDFGVPHDALHLCNNNTIQESNNRDEDEGMETDPGDSFTSNQDPPLHNGSGSNLRCGDASLQSLQHPPSSFNGWRLENINQSSEQEGNTMVGVGEPREVSQFATDVNNILRIVSEDMYQIWCDGFQTLDPLQRALRGLMARTILDYKNRIDDHENLRNWMAVFRNLDVNGFGNITRDGLAAAIRTLVNGAKLYATTHATTHANKEEVQAAAGGRRSEDQLNRSDSTDNDTLRSWGHALSAPSAVLRRDNMDFRSMTSSGRSSVSDSILGTSTVATARNPSTENSEIKSMDSSLRDVLRGSKSNSIELSASSVNLDPNAKLDHCDCLSHSAASLGYIGQSTLQLCSMEDDTEAGIDKMLSLFHIIDIEGRGLLEPHVFLASVFDDKFLEDEEIVKQLYDHIRGGDMMTDTTLKSYLDWNYQSSASFQQLNICQPRVFWPSAHGDLDADDARVLQRQIRALFRHHGFSRGTSHSCLSEVDDCEEISLKVFSAALSSCTVHSPRRNQRGGAVA
eukprot:GHVH01011878.1.p1 GENE.GHVH01011878.1~~GHVH01011878.1.p1  ORF type:complete len:1019 (+),score=142.72 GHVH01011878.1:68-3124(+)